MPGKARFKNASSTASKKLFKRHESIYSQLLLGLDLFISFFSLYFCVVLRGVEFGPQYRGLIVLALLLIVVIYQSFGTYQRPLDAIGIVTRLSKAWGAVLVSLVFLAFLTKTSDIYSRQVILTWIAATYFLQIAAHFLFLIAQKKLNGNSNWKEPAVLVGAGHLGKYMVESINNDPWIPEKIIGVADDDETALSAWQAPEVFTIGGTDKLLNYLRDNHVKRVYVALPLNASASLERLYVDLLATNIDISWVPDIFGMTLINPNIREVAGVPVFALSETPLIGSRAVTKAIMDKLIAVLAIIITSPIMLATAVAIKLSSPGPTLFRQMRHGWNGKVIEVWKFRSMETHEQSEGVVKQATRNDPRVTRVGRFIRATSIDELPQLFNVLQGRMSIVGPRPHAVEHNNYYSKLIHTYFTRHKIKPGITGLAQVKGYRGETQTLEKMEKRVETDLEYINNWSIALDLKIMIQTVFILFSRNAY